MTGTTLKQALVAVTDTAVQLGGTALSRTAILIKNASTNTKTFYIGDANVTATGATQGMPVAPGDALTIPVVKGAAIFAIATGAGENVNILEIG